MNEKRDLYSNQNETCYLYLVSNDCLVFHYSSFFDSVGILLGVVIGRLQDSFKKYEIYIEKPWIWKTTRKNMYLWQLSIIRNLYKKLCKVLTKGRPSESGRQKSASDLIHPFECILSITYIYCSIVLLLTQWARGAGFPCQSRKAKFQVEIGHSNGISEVVPKVRRISM